MKLLMVVLVLRFLDLTDLSLSSGVARLRWFSGGESTFSFALPRKPSQPSDT